MAISREISNRAEEGTILNNLAELYSSQGRYTEAEPLYQEALKIQEEILGKEHPNVAKTLKNLSILYQKQGNFAQAAHFYQRYLEILEKIQSLNYYPLTVVKNITGRTRLDDSNLETSFLNHKNIEIKKRKLNINITQNFSDSLSVPLPYIIETFNIQEAHIRQNLVYGDESQKNDFLKELSRATNIPISLHFQSSSDNRELSNFAFTTILRHKGRILDILTRNIQILRQQTDDSITQDLLTQLIPLRNQYSNLVFRKPEDIKSPAIHRQQLIELETQTQQLEDQLSRRSSEFRNLSEPITLEKVQQLIPQNSALVELVRYEPFNSQASIGERWGKPRYAAYILRSQGQPQKIDLGEAEPIDRAVEQFRRNLCTKTKTPEATQFCLDNLSIAQVKSSAKTLEQMVMQPVRQLIGETKNILLSPDSKLNLLPFEALVDENERYLVENYNFTYLTSGRDLIRLQLKSPSEEQPLVIADPLYNREANLVASDFPQRSIEDISQLFDKLSFEPLPATEKEAQAIQSLLNLPSERIKLQNQANEVLLKQVKSPHFLHIATHGFFLDKPSTTKSEQETPIQINDNPLFRSGLVLAGVESRPSQVKSENDGVFTAYEATFLDLVGTKLVVLSACDTGVGEITTGEGIYGLRRSLVIAGSESQLISLWKVSSEGTKDLMLAYYQRLQQGEGRTTALHEVQKQMLRGELKGEKGQSYQHPYYWASFIPSGDWTPMDFSNSR